jgi:hypothetical protein
MLGYKIEDRILDEADIQAENRSQNRVCCWSKKGRVEAEEMGSASKQTA